MVAENEELTGDCEGNGINTVSLGSLGSIKFNITAADTLEYVDSAGFGDGDIETMYDGVLVFTDNTVTFTEDDGDEVTGVDIAFNLSWDDTDEELYVDATTINAGAPTWNEIEDGDDDTKQAVSDKGTLLEKDFDEKLSLKIWAPEEDVYANVFITPLTATVTAAGATGDAVSVNPFSVGLAVLDSDAESMSKNMIVVGGPCVNTVAADLMESGADCAAGFEAGKAMLKFFDREGKSALLVAGYEAEDTVRAAYVLAQHDGKYRSKFMSLGSEVELVVADMEDVLFNTA